MPTHQKLGYITYSNTENIPQTAYILARTNYNPKKDWTCGWAIKLRKSQKKHKSDVFMFDESEYLKSNPEILQKLLSGETIYL